jgi:hypothetical protein
MNAMGRCLAILACSAAWLWGVDAASAQQPGQLPADPWPREIAVANAKLLVYEPQVNSWSGNTLDFRAAVAVRPAGAKPEIFGVIWATARTQVDRVSRIVALEGFTVTRGDFPTLPDRGASYVAALQQSLARSQRTIALDRLEASLAAAGAVKPLTVAVNNDPPRILVSEVPAILVPMDGAPVVRVVPGTIFERAINTRALVIREQGTSAWYLHVYDGWLSSTAIAGPWAQAFGIPPALGRTTQQLAARAQVDLLDGGNTKPKPSLAGGVPTIYVSETPAELLVFRGQPSYTRVPGTDLDWASNTTADVLYDTGGRNYYILVSGRWYRAALLTGPWTFVASTDLPADFRRIPANEPAGVVLSAVAGTPQAEEAVIANSIPQTATVPRVNGPQFSSVIDGAPQLRPVEGTSLQYVWNSPTPIIQVSASSYYALSAGIWFGGMSLWGPWSVAAYVPGAIYTIPPISPLHYVTYVQVYGSTAKAVYVGYTPGYLGTVVAPGGVVVYGTGYTYQTWIGSAWYPPPATYGIMAAPIYNPAVGMAFGFAMGVTTAAMTGAFYHPAYFPGYYGYPCCGATSANVYGHWGNASWSGTRSYYSNSSGYGESASGNYTNYRTGTTGNYSASRSVDTSAGTAQRSYSRSFNTVGGTSGAVNRSETYSASTGRYSYASNMSATGPAGTQVTHSGQAGPTAAGGIGAERQTTMTNPNTGISRSTSMSAGVGPQGSGAERQTTLTNPATGATATTAHASGASSAGAGRGFQTTYTNPTTVQTKSYGAAREGNNVYADNSGNVYRNSGSGWQQHTSSGWQSTSGDTSWADREQQARNQGEDRFSNFSQSSGGWANRFGGGGWANRFGGGGGGWASRFGGGGGGWGDRFGESGGWRGRSFGGRGRW